MNQICDIPDKMWIRYYGTGDAAQDSPYNMHPLLLGLFCCNYITFSVDLRDPCPYASLGVWLLLGFMNITNW